MRNLSTLRYSLAEIKATYEELLLRVPHCPFIKAFMERKDPTLNFKQLSAAGTIKPELLKNWGKLATEQARKGVIDCAARGVEVCAKYLEAAEIPEGRIVVLWYVFMTCAQICTFCEEYESVEPFECQVLKLLRYMDAKADDLTFTCCFCAQELKPVELCPIES